MNSPASRGSAFLLPATLVVLVGAWAGWVELSGRAFLPRHTAARDLPYALRGGDLARQPFNRAMTDPVNLLYPDRAFAAAELREGRLPLWNHQILCGVAHAANPLTASFYPPNFLAAFLDPLDFLLVSAALHVFLAGVLFQAWLLAAGARPSAAALGGLAFALSGWVAAHLHNTQLVAAVVWIPFGLAGIEWILGGRRKRGVLALALSLALQWLAGFSLFAVFGCLVLGVYAAVSLLVMRGPTLRERGVLAARVLGAVAIGLFLASIQLLPTLDARSRAARTGSTRAELLEGQAFGPGVLSGLALPSWLGDAHEKPVTEDPDGDLDHAARRDAALLVLGRTSDGKVPPINAFGERTLYAGGTVLLLALAGLGALRRRAALVLLAPAALAAAFAFGLLPPDPVLAVLGLNVGAPGRAVLVLVLAVPALAAFGLDRLFDAAPAPLAWTLLRVGACVAGIGGLAAAVAGFAARDATLEALLSSLRAAGAGAALGAPADVPIATYVTHLRPAFERLTHDLLFFSLFVLAAWIVLERARRSAKASGDRADGLRLAALPLLALVVIDLGWFFLRTIRPVARERLFEPTPALEFLKEQSSRGRFARVSPDRASAAPGDMDSLLPPNLGLCHGLVDAQGYRELVPARLLRLVQGVSALTAPVGFAGFALPDAGSPVLDLLSARWLIAARPLDESGEAWARAGLRRVPLGGAEGADSAPASRPAADVVVYENPDARPFAWIVRESAVAGDDEAVEALRTGASDFRTRVLLEQAADGLPGPAPERPTDEQVSVKFLPDSIRIDATLSSPAFLVLSTCWDPGWRATIWHGPWRQDRGGERPVLRANAAFMAVLAPAGSQTIELRYRPPSLTLGLVLAGVAALVLLVWTAWPARRPRTQAPGAP
jgi:hypothetical protein